MVLKNSLIFINELTEYVFDQIRKIYLSSTFYNRKISKTDHESLNYVPSLILLSAIVKIGQKKYKIEEFDLNTIWTNNKIIKKDFIKIQNFYWLFSLDLKSSKKNVQNIIESWIDKNLNYNSEIWENDILSKRVISWISNSSLTYEESSEIYKEKFNFIIKKQINHLINEINRSKNLDDKIISCAAIILTGLSFNDQKFLNFGFDLLNKIISSSINNLSFPKSRNFRQLIFYLKYFILIREFLKESQNEIPDKLNEVIYNLGQGYNLIWQSKNINFLFNGNHISDNSDFDKYLKTNEYKFKNENYEISGYGILRNNNTCLTMDIGNAPDKKFSESYQAGPLSFEITYSGEKLITNSGYYQNQKHQLHRISKTTANHSTLILNNTSTSRFVKNRKGQYLLDKNFKISNKNIIYDKNYWSIKATHDAYLKKFGITHERKIEFFPLENKFIGTDKIVRKKNKVFPFEIRFHLLPSTKVTKTQDEKSILIQTVNSGWRFYCKNHLLDIETGLYFGNKNSYVENQNIFIADNIVENNQEIIWICEKI